MSSERIKQVLAVALLAVLAIALWSRLGPELGSGSGGGRQLPSDGVSGRDPAGEVLELARLEPEVRNRTVRRDPFRFGELPRPVTPPPPQRARPVVTPPPPPPPQETGPQPPAVDLTYLGRFGPERRPIAVLKGGESIFNARVGDVVGEHFRVKTIGLESIDLEYVDFPEVPAQRLVVGS